MVWKPFFSENVFEDVFLLSLFSYCFAFPFPVSAPYTLLGMQLSTGAR